MIDKYVLISMWEKEGVRGNIVLLNINTYQTTLSIRSEVGVQWYIFQKIPQLFLVWSFARHVQCTVSANMFLVCVHYYNADNLAF